MRLCYHCGVPAADELADLVEDAFAVDAFVQRASLHDDGHSQQDLLTDVLLQAAGARRRQGRCRGTEGLLSIKFRKSFTTERLTTYSKSGLRHTAGLSIALAPLGELFTYNMGKMSSYKSNNLPAEYLDAIYLKQAYISCGNITCELFCLISGLLRYLHQKLR